MHGFEFARDLDAAYLFVHGECEILSTPNAAVQSLLGVCRTMRIDTGPEPRTVAQCMEVYCATMRFRGGGDGGRRAGLLPSMAGSLFSGPAPERRGRSAPERR